MSDKVSSAENQQGSPAKRDPSETTRQISQMNQQLAILTGLLFTDGCVSRKGMSWRMYFSNTSFNLIELFKNCMIHAFRLPSVRVRIRKKGANFWVAVVNSREIGDYLWKNFGTFRTLRFKDGKLPEARIPIAKLSKDKYVRDFLKAAFSCDGGISFYPAHRNGARGGTHWLIRTVFLCCKHPQLRKDYLCLLTILGIKARELPKDGRIEIETENDIKRFSQLVGFVEGTRITQHSKFWNGQEKQKILRRMVASYGNPASIYNLPQFHLR